MKWHLMSKMWVYMINFGVTGSCLLNKILRYPIQSINSYFYKTIYPSLLEWDVQSMFVYMAVVKKDNIHAALDDYMDTDWQYWVQPT